MRFRVNLQEDTAQINTVIRFDSIKLGSIQKTFDAFGSGQSEFQIIVKMGDYFEYLFSFSELKQSRVAFDNMVSSESINLISDRELRTELSNYYSRSFSSEERVREVTRKTRDLLAPYMFTKETVGMFSPNLKVKIPDDEIKFYQNRLVFSTINGNKVLTEQQIFQAFEMNIEAVELMELIDEFLKGAN